MSNEFAVVVPWINQHQMESFLRAWRIDDIPGWLVLIQDKNREGCGATKNKGVGLAEAKGADVVVVLDDDCYPVPEFNGVPTLQQHALWHVEALLTPQPVDLFETVTSPPSRGTPYGELTARIPVAASMGYWEGIGDYCAPRQITHGSGPMQFLGSTVYQRWFPLSGMNMAFRPADWKPWCTFIDVPRFDDIWMGWLWQKEAYRRGYCFNLRGPVVKHARQSNAWKNLRVEAEYLEANETLWREIALSPETEYEELVKLLPPHEGGSDR